nr:DUF317 domain-containing protein [Streptomyces akebiae]
MLEHAYVRKNPAAPVWSAWGGPPGSTLWKATFSSAVPASLVAAFASSLASTVPLARAVWSVPAEARLHLTLPKPGPTQSDTSPDCRSAGHLRRRPPRRARTPGPRHRAPAQCACPVPDFLPAAAGDRPCAPSAVEEHHRICPCTSSTSSPNSSTCQSTNDG